MHVILGLLLVLAALGLVVQGARARNRVLTTTSVVGLVAMIAAAASGASFVSKDRPSTSMAMAIFTGVGLLAYGSNLYLLSSRGRRDAS